MVMTYKSQYLIIGAALWEKLKYYWISPILKTCIITSNIKTAQLPNYYEANLAYRNQTNIFSLC